MSKRNPGWADLKNAQSVQRQSDKLSALRENARRTQLAQFASRLGDDTSRGPEATKSVVRSIVEGDTRTNSQQFEELEAEQAALRAELAASRARLDDLGEPFRNALRQRHQQLERDTRWDDHGRRSVLPTAGGSRGVVAAVISGVVLLEALLLTTAGESIVRSLFPSLDRVMFVASLGVAALVLGGAATVVMAARALKEYYTFKALAKIAMADAMDGSISVLQPPSATPVQLWTLAAILIQAGLMVLRFQSDTGSSTSRRDFIIVSVLVALLAVVVGLLEYRRHDVAVPVTYDAPVIDEVIARHTDVTHNIPAAIADREIKKFQLFTGALHEHQRFGAEIANPDVLPAIHALLDDYQVEIQRAKGEVGEFVPLDIPALTREAVERHAAKEARTLDFLPFDDWKQPSAFVD